MAGVIPVTLALPPVLQALDIGINDLSGEIPEQLATVWRLRIFIAGGKRFSGCFPFRVRIMMARTLGEKIEGSTTCWHVLSGPGQGSDLERLDIRYSEAPEPYRAIRINDVGDLRALIDGGADVNKDALRAGGGCHALHQACSRGLCFGRFGWVQAFLRTGPYWNLRQCRHETGLRH
ncbi:MAG: hypothetical protein OXG12_09225 [Cyanobacteria bacterium MAG COS4_bin_21]|nr:hypothetical protein [Cyanobacteria bacterium MAG COS4_bin_21]